MRAAASIFRRFDRNGDGTIKREVLAQVLGELGISDDGIDLVISEADAGRNGAVDVEKFLSWVWRGGSNQDALMGHADTKAHAPSKTAVDHAGSEGQRCLGGLIHVVDAEWQAQELLQGPARRVTLSDLPSLRTTDIDAAEPHCSVAARWRSGEPFEVLERGVEKQVDPWPAAAEVERQLRSHLMLARLDERVERAFEACAPRARERVVVLLRLPAEPDVADPTAPAPAGGEALPANVLWLGQSLWALVSAHRRQDRVSAVCVVVAAARPDDRDLVHRAIAAAVEDDHIYYGARLHDLPTRGNKPGNQEVSVDTITRRLSSLEKREGYANHARANLSRWQQAAAPGSPRRRGDLLLGLFSREQGVLSPSLTSVPKAGGAGRGGEASRDVAVLVAPCDWGEVTGKLTRHFGVRCGALNMANARRFGGSYLKGSFAQEENMSRRTAFHYTRRWGGDLVPVPVPGDPHINLYYGYKPEMAELIAGGDGRRVYLSEEPLVLIRRGQEGPTSGHASWSVLPDGEVVPFWELRAAFPDLRLPAVAGDPGRVAEDCRRVVAAIFTTLREAGIRHAVLGALGCGVFGHPAEAVARLFAQQIRMPENVEHFEVVAFAIYAAPGVAQGKKGDNFTPFREALEEALKS